MPSRVRFVATATCQLPAKSMVTFPSYEERFLASLDRACNALSLTEVVLVVFGDYFEEIPVRSEVDAEAARAYRLHYLEARRRLTARGISTREMKVGLDDLPAFIDVV